MPQGSSRAACDSSHTKMIVAVRLDGGFRGLKFILSTEWENVIDPEIEILIIVQPSIIEKEDRI